MGKCFVPNCNTGCKSCKSKFSLFKPPGDAEKLATWRRAIPRQDRVLSRQDRVCERHFAPHFLVKTWCAKYENHVLMQGNRRATLTKDAVPSIFDDCPAYLSRSVRPPRKQGKHKAASAASSAASAKSRRISTGGGVSSSGIVSSEDVQASSSTEVHDGAAAPAPSTFDLLFENANSVTLPEASWAVHRVDMEGVRDVVYSKIVVSQGSPVSTLCISKAVHIKSDASVNVLLLGKLLDCDSVGVVQTVSTIADIEPILRTVEAIRICSGGTQYQGVPRSAPRMRLC
ncbi:hypothetical protein ISCGN_006005 [Ixodes scapularis]